MLEMNKYPTGIKSKKKQVEESGIIRDEFHEECNYTFKPKSTASQLNYFVIALSEVLILTLL
jgi:hypothetical protein